jgi:hypothetical protein
MITHVMDVSAQAGRIGGMLLALGFFSGACSFGPSFRGESEGTPVPTSTAPPQQPPDTARAVCGNGVVELGEACDDGASNSDTLPGACRTTCTRASCGDGVRAENEICDDGAANSNVNPNACRTGCVRPWCGDGIVDVGEECDGAQACSVDCKVVACGNGRLEEGEECEPGLSAACSADCRSVACGNGRVDAGEECEPPSGVTCSAQCLAIACGNGRVDPGEECDPPALGRCDSACGSVVCGNGSVEEGEGCDPPSPGVCDASCRPAGCGDGKVDSGEECDPPAAGACDGACLAIVCGNGRMDAGEQCDPPASGSCDASCRDIVCGDARVDAGEECDPPERGRCTDRCERVVCGDGRLDPGEACEPSGSNDPDCSSSCTVVDSTGTEYLYSFDSGTEGWTLYATSPERLESNTDVRYDSQNGDKTPGALRLSAPFDGSNQKIEVQATFNPIDLRGRTIVARVRLGSGLSADATNPGGIKLFVKTGASFNYASGAWAYLRPGEGWVDVTFDCDAPVLVPSEFDASQVRQLGVELRTFTETTQVSPAVVYLDAVSF